MFKSIFKDLLLVYKNFLHWNISKILIYVTVTILAILFFSPFLLINIVIWYLDPINWKEVLFWMTSWTMLWYEAYTSFFENMSVFIIQSVIFITWVAMIFLAFSYKTILFSKLNLSYIEWEKMWYKLWNYLNWKLLWAYFWIVGWMGLFLFIPIALFLVIFALLVFSYGWLDSVVQISSWINSFWIISLILFIVTVLSFIYLSYRLTFSLVNVVDNDRFPEVLKSTRIYIKDSCEISKWLKFFKFLLFILIFFIIILPFSYIQDNLIVDVYIYYAYVVFMFIIFTWLFEMLIASLYKRVMLEKIEDTKQDNNKENNNVVTNEL